MGGSLKRDWMVQGQRMEREGGREKESTWKQADDTVIGYCSLENKMEALIWPTSRSYVH